MIVYDTRAGSGTTKHFAKRLAKVLGMPVVNVKSVEGKIGSEYILCTYTAGRGEVPLETQEFLKDNHENMVGVVANGSSNFRQFGLFCAAGDRIADTYGVEQIKKLDMGGTPGDIIYVAKRVNWLMGLDKVVEEGSIKPRSTFINGKFNLQSI